MVKRLLLALVALAGFASIRTMFADEKPPAREIYVPFEELNVLLEGPTRRVLMSRAEYDDLLKQARKSPEDKTPLTAVLLAADYDVSADGLRARITAKLVCEVLTDGLHVLPLDFEGVGILTATLDDKPASLGRGDDGRLRLFVAGRGRHDVVLTMAALLETNASQQVLKVRLPRLPASRMTATVAGNVEVRSGADVIRREVDEAAEVTRFELLPVDGPMTLAMSLNNRRRQQQRVVVARSVVVDEVTSAYERLHATISLSILHQAVDRFRFAMPAGFEISDVQSPLLARWSLSDENGGKVLEVVLRRETTEPVVLSLSATRSPARLDNWKFPELTPLDVAGKVSVLGVLLEDRLKAEDIDGDGLLPIDTEVLRGALPAGVFAAEPGAPKVRSIVSYFAPDGEANISARFTQPPSTLRVTTNVLLTVSDRGLAVRGGFALAPEAEALHEFDFTVPAGWQIGSVTLLDGTALPFERYGALDADSRLHVRLPTKIAPGSPQSVYFSAHRDPTGWLDDWTMQNVEFPAFAVVGAASDVGALAVDVRDDLTVRPDVLTNLTPLDEAEKPAYGLTNVPTRTSYRYEAPGYRATLIIERTTPRLTARTFSFFRIAPELLTAHYEVAFDVARARTRKVSFLLPKSTPASVTIRGLDNLAVKEYSSEETDEGRSWTALLADAAAGRLRLAVDFQQPLATDGAQEHTLPIVRAEGVAYQSGLVAVEGSAEINVQMVRHPRKVDVGELVDAEYQPGRRLLGAFGFVGDDPEVVLKTSRDPEYGLQPALVQQAKYVTLLGTNGRAQTSAELQIRTKSAFLEVKLPPQSTLWSAALDGIPAQPQREGDRLLLSFPASSGDALRRLDVVYESPVEAIASLGRVRVPALVLMLRAAAGADAVEVPTADVDWQLHLPRSYRILHSSGTVTTTDRGQVPQLAVVHLGEAIADATGGIGGPGRYASDLARGSAVRAKSALSSYERMPMDADEDREAKPDVAFLPEQLTSQRDGLVAGKPETRLPAATAQPPMAPPPGAAPTTAPAPAKPMIPQSYPKFPKGAAPVAESAPSTPAGGGVIFNGGVTFSGGAGVNSSGGIGGGGGGFASRAAVANLAGVRSLKIDLQATENVATFQSLGSNPQIDVVLVDARRADAAACALAMIVFLWGALLVRRSASARFRYLVVVCLLTTLLPLVTGWYELAWLVNPSFYAACWLVPFYLAVSVGRWLCGKCRSIFARGATSMTLVLSVLVSAATLQAAEPLNPAAPIAVEISAEGAPVKVPEDATILLYRTTNQLGIPAADQMLVPLDRYQELWNRAHPEKKIDPPPPAPYAFAGATFAATLGEEDFLNVEGRIAVDLFTDGFVEIPLRLTGGVLSSAKLDGKPARFNIVRPEMKPVQQGQAASSVVVQPLLVLVASGKGRHEIELAIRLGVEKVGGGRVASAQLPAVPAAELRLTVPAAETDVRLGGVPDRRSYTTTKAGETIATALGLGGDVRMEWRPKLDDGRIDQTLKVRSDAVLAVQEDGLRLAWKATLEFSRTEREAFTVGVPKDYLVERVAGENVRGWEQRDEGAERRLEVTLLRAATERETFTIYLSRRERVGEGMTELTAPIVTVQDAAVHSGTYTVRRSAALDLRTVEAAGLTRIDLLPDAEQAPAAADVADVSPLGMRPYQSYRFASTSFTLKFAASPPESQVAAEVRTIVKIAERERRLESQLEFNVVGPPIHRVRAYLPDDLQLEQVSAPGAFEWAVTTENDRRLLSVYFSAGQTGRVRVVLAGMLGKQGPATTVPLPRLDVIDVERQQGDVVVQVDPAFDVEPVDLRNLERVLLDRTFGWLEDRQRSLARLALHYTTGDYGGNLRIVVRQPTVQCNTVTNVRVTDRIVEETILLDFTIRDAGVREVVFLLPASLREARINVPRLRQKIIEPIGDDGRRIRVRLQLQDEVMSQLRVLVESDRVRSSTTDDAPIPVVETGRTEGRFVALESSGRDEVVVERAEGLEPLNRRGREWQVIAGLLRGGSTQAYRVVPDAAEPRLSYVSRTRDIVETVGARIGLAEVIMVVDDSAAYRAVQTYRIDNQSEQFLIVELPAGAVLWTAWVAGEPVKPTRDPQAKSPREVRIPLVKTAEGDLDYEVKLTYGGDLRSFGVFDEVKFPLIQTKNVKVELSQVRLYLPESYRWVSFGGTMRIVPEEADLQAGNLSYLNKSTEKLARTLERGDDFAKLRASNSLKALKSDVDSYVGSISKSGAGTLNIELRQQLDDNRRVWQAAEQEQQKQQPAQPQAQGPQQAAQTGTLTLSGGNTYVLEGVYQSQENTRSKNVVNDLGFNFKAQAEPAAAATKDGEKGQQFDSAWLIRNNLSSSGEKNEAFGRRLEEQTVSQLRGITGAGNVNINPAAPMVQEASKGLTDSLTDLKKSRERVDVGAVNVFVESGRGGEARDSQAAVMQRYQQRLDAQNAQQAQAVPQNRMGLAGSAAEAPMQRQTALGAMNAPAGTKGAAFIGDGFDTDVMPADAQGLASLDVQIPRRGVVYRFTTPLGDADVTARPVPTLLVDSVQRLIAVVVFLIILRIVWVLAASGRLAKFSLSRLGAVTITAVGFLSMVLWVFPVAGFLLFVAGVILMIRRLFIRSKPARA